MIPNNPSTLVLRVISMYVLSVILRICKPVYVYLPLTLCWPCRPKHVKIKIRFFNLQLLCILFAPSLLVVYLCAIENAVLQELNYVISDYNRYFVIVIIIIIINMKYMRIVLLRIPKFTVAVRRIMKFVIIGFESRIVEHEWWENRWPV